MILTSRDGERPLSSSRRGDAVGFALTEPLRDGRTQRPQLKRATSAATEYCQFEEIVK